MKPNEPRCTCPEDESGRMATYTCQRDTEPHAVGCPRWATPAQPDGDSGRCVVTSPVPDALRTQLAEVLAAHVDQITETDDGRFRYGCTCGHVRGVFTETQAIVRLRTRESIAEQRLHVADALLPLFARARVEGAAEALRDLEDPLDSWWTERAEEDRFTDLDDVIVWLRRRAALSASTTTEGDPT